MIRVATLDDLEQIVDIYNASIPGRMATADLTPVSVVARRAWFDSHRDDRRPLWVFEQEDAIAGWLSLTDWHTRIAYAATVQVGVYVSPHAQRQGVGRALLEHAVAAAPALGIRRIIGQVFAHNTASLALFERCGFERWGLLPGVTVLDGIERDVAIIGLRC